MKVRTLALALTCACAPVMFGAPLNVALNKTVTLDGVFGNSTAGTPIVWGDPAPVAASSVVDGIFRTDQQNWQTNSVWWHEYLLPTTYIEVDLGGPFTLIGAVVQADNNDQYLLEFLDGSDEWQTLWNISVSCCNGVATRPNRLDNTQMHTFAAPVTTSAVRISGVPGSDRYFTVTELQLYAVPEPSTFALAACGLTAAVLWRRRRQAS